MELLLVNLHKKSVWKQHQKTDKQNFKATGNRYQKQVFLKESAQKNNYFRETLTLTLTKRNNMNRILILQNILTLTKVIQPITRYLDARYILKSMLRKKYDRWIYEFFRRATSRLTGDCTKNRECERKHTTTWIRSIANKEDIKPITQTRLKLSQLLLCNKF